MVQDAIYNDIDDGVIFFSKPNDGETHVQQSYRMHMARKRTSEWLVSEKIPRRGHTITDDFPPTQNIVVKDVLFRFLLIQFCMIQVIMNGIIR